MRLPISAVVPDYAGGSIVNLSSSFAGHFGVQALAAPLATALPLDDVETIVLFVVDGLGQWQLEKHLADHDMPTVRGLLEESQVGTLTSVFPSTTMAAITGLHMAATPAQTGWLGYLMWLEEVQAVTEMIGQVDVAKQQKLESPHFLKHTEGMYAQLERVGVSAYSVAPTEYRGTWLNEWYWQGAMQYGYVTANTCASVGQVALQLEGKKIVVVYWADYDSVCHKHGPSSRAASDEVSAVDHALQRFIKHIPKDGKTLFALTADHGQIDLLEKKAIYLEQNQEFMQCLRSPPSGDRVCRNLRVHPEKITLAREILEVHSDTILASEAWEAGLFGGLPDKETFRQRVGDIIAFPRDGAQLLFTFPNKQPSRPHRGSHGALSSEEMVVPLIVTRF